MDYRIDYSPPKRHLDVGKSPGIQWNLSIPDEGMRGRSEYIFRMDPMLGYDDIASMIMEKYGNFSCRFCYSPLVMDGTNGSGTREFLCRKCSRKMSLYNTFELVTFRYRKELTAFLSYIHCSSSDGSASLCVTPLRPEKSSIIPGGSREDSSLFTETEEKASVLR